MKPVVCISFPLIFFFLRKYNYTSWGILCHPLLISFSQPEPLCCDRFQPLITAWGNSPLPASLLPRVPPLLLRYPQVSNRPCSARLGSALLVQEAANQSPGNKSWETLLACKVRCGWTSWIAPWFWISWSRSLGLGKDLYDGTKSLCLFSWGVVLHSSVCLCGERGREWTISCLVKFSACLFIHILSLAPFCDENNSKEKKSTFLHVTLCLFSDGFHPEEYPHCFCCYFIFI